jgi:hypothetical protein
MQKRRPERKPSALKHGVFSTSAILPGENLKEFNKLVKSLTAEWQPSGALEKETVLTLAECLWRKRRLDIFREMQRSKADYSMLMQFGKIVSENTTEIEDSEADQIQEIDQIRTEAQQLFSNQNNFKEKTIHDMLTPMFDTFGLDEEQRTAWVKEAKELGELGALAEDFTLEELQKQLDLQERLEGMIDRCIKRLVHIKASKRLIQLDSHASTVPSRLPTGSESKRTAVLK